VAQVSDQAAELEQLLERLGGRYIADVSPSGGRHVFVLFAAALPWRELRDVARALALRFPSIDTAPMSSLGKPGVPVVLAEKPADLADLR
jgi:DNA primase